MPTSLSKTRRQSVPSHILVVSSVSHISSYPCIMINCRFLWWGGRLKRRRCCPGLLELSRTADSTIQAATGCCGFPERVATSLPFIRTGVVKTGKEWTASLVKGTSSLNLLPHTWIIPLPPTTHIKYSPLCRTSRRLHSLNSSSTWLADM